MTNYAVLGAALFFLSLGFTSLYKRSLGKEQVFVAAAAALLMVVLVLASAGSDASWQWRGMATILQWMVTSAVFAAGNGLLLRRSWQEALGLGVFGGTWVTLVLALWL